MATLKQNTIFKNILIIAFIYVAVIFGVLQWLKKYTQHGVTIKVPELLGKSPQELKELEKTVNLEFIINDSVYIYDRKKGTVIDQNPGAHSVVKQNRKVYITLNAYKPPTIKMPRLIDMSLRQAKAVLETYGLVVGNLKYEPDFAKDAVLKQYFKGREIKTGDPIVIESKIDLVLGDGLKGDKVEVPFLIGLNRVDANNKLKSYSLNVGSEVYDKSVIDTSKSLVYRQFPSYSADAKVSIGRSVDLFFTQDESKINIAKDSLNQQNDKIINDQD